MRRLGRDAAGKGQGDGNATLAASNLVSGTPAFEDRASRMLPLAKLKFWHAKLDFGPKLLAKLNFGHA
jgi:hypothetical protein